MDYHHVTTGVGVIGAILTLLLGVVMLLVSSWDKLGDTLYQVRLGSPATVMILSIIIVGFCIYLLLQKRRELDNDESMDTLLRFEAQVKQLSQAQA